MFQMALDYMESIRAMFIISSTDQFSIELKAFSDSESYVKRNFILGYVPMQVCIPLEYSQLYATRSESSLLNSLIDIL